MGRPRNENIATDAELSWFNLEHYASLRGDAAEHWASNEAGTETYRQWSSLIRDRVEFRRFLDAGERDYVGRMFEKVKLAPLSPLGFKRGDRLALHPADTETVTMISTNRIKTLHRELNEAAAPSVSSADEVLAGYPESQLSGFAHLTISTAATDKQLLSDFQSWLSAWRSSSKDVLGGDFPNKISNWRRSLVLPYQDLQLFTALTGKSITLQKKLSLLIPGRTAGEQDAFRSKVGKMARLVFSEDMSLLVSHLANGEARMREKK